MLYTWRAICFQSVNSLSIYLAHSSICRPGCIFLGLISVFLLLILIGAKLFQDLLVQLSPFLHQTIGICVSMIDPDLFLRFLKATNFRAKCGYKSYIHLYSPYMVERDKQTYIYKQINKTDRENKQQSINIAGIHLNGKIIKLSLISNGTYLNRYNTISRKKQHSIK